MWPALATLVVAQAPLTFTSLPLGEPDASMLMTATPQPDGFALFTGGIDFRSATAFSRTLLFDPLTGVMHSGPAMASTRWVHNAVRLPSGETLVTGDAPNAELYVPKISTWADAGRPADFRFDAQLLRLADVVLLIGGRTAASTAQSRLVDSYDALGRTWFPYPPLPTPLDTSCGLALEDGGALLFGGDDGGGTEVHHWWRLQGKTFVAGGPLIEDRSDAVCVRWDDDVVSVIGGARSDAGELSTVELVDLKTGTVTSGQPAPATSMDLASALLPSGRVLQHDNGKALLYDRANGWSQWQVSGRHYQGNAIVLPTGRTLVAGGDSVGATIVDERTETWGDGGRMPGGRFGAVAIVLPDGRVLLLGGTDDSFAPSSSVLVYDPRSRAWSDGGTLLAPRQLSSGTLLLDGTVFLSGGADSPAGSSTELYDPATGSSVNGPALLTARVFHRSVLLEDGRVAVLGGSSGGTGVTPDTEIYDPASRVMSKGPPLAEPRSQFETARLSSGRVLIVGGVGSGRLGTTELWSVDGGRTLGSLGMGRDTVALTVLPGGRDVLLAGGAGVNGALREVWRFDIESETWRQRADMPLPGATKGLVLRDGLVLLPFGGFSQHYLTYDPLSEQWSAFDAGTTRIQAASVRLADGDVLSSGGFVAGTRDSTLRYRDEGPAGLPRPTIRLRDSAVTAGGGIYYSGSGLQQPSRLGGSTGDQTSWDEAVLVLESMETGELRLLSTRVASASDGKAAVPPDLALGWYRVWPSVHGVLGASSPVFVGLALGAPCRFHAQCVTRACSGVCVASLPDAGVPDAGVADAGMRDGGGITEPPTMRFARVECGCGTGAEGLVLLAVLLLRSRRARSQRAAH